MGTNLRINADRLWDSLMEMAKSGATEKGGVCRLALTDLDKQARDLFCAWAKEAGCSIKIDKMGTGYTLIASSSGLTNSQSAPFDILVGTATKLAVIVQPVNGLPAR